MRLGTHTRRLLIIGLKPPQYYYRNIKLSFLEVIATKIPVPFRYQRCSLIATFNHPRQEGLLTSYRYALLEPFM